MQDSEQRYPRRDSAHNSDQQNLNDGTFVETDIPASGWPMTLIIAIGGGLLAVVISIILTYANASTYQEAARLGGNMPYNTAVVLLWLAVIGYVLELLFSFFAGFFVGKMVVRRRFGFYAGLIVGAISYLGYILAHQIPGYPDSLGFTAPAGSSSAITGALLYLLVVFLIRALIAGLVGLWGSWSATRKHPYYRRRTIIEEEV
ncbi:hypothetical protein [Tengunoibacter tsumagoiensis]|uniref:Uncharacterized protein n=1 Tax=Tengunoibacter tsumagoiensis TaxID=2014871 RepID=A0A401ZWK9_9CHLR|nr:hypothetical protein [Tengunoibacter tsumagoiensis]GCE11247.1 hypothetical protein KTT_11060 [Tengunoibacter tsumagoiensis]